MKLILDRLLELSVKSGNRYWVESYALVPLPEGSVVEKNILNPEAGGCIRARTQSANTQSTAAALAIPTSMVITKTIEMDADMTDDEREVQIRMDAEQYIPFPLDEASLDFEVLPERLDKPESGERAFWLRPVLKMWKHVLKCWNLLV